MSQSSRMPRNEARRKTTRKRRGLQEEAERVRAQAPLRRLGAPALRGGCLQRLRCAGKQLAASWRASGLGHSGLIPTHPKGGVRPRHAGEKLQALESKPGLKEQAEPGLGMLRYAGHALGSEPDARFRSGLRAGWEAKARPRERWNPEEGPMARALSWAMKWTRCRAMRWTRHRMMSWTTSWKRRTRRRGDGRRDEKPWFGVRRSRAHPRVRSVPPIRRRRRSPAFPMGRSRKGSPMQDWPQERSRFCGWRKERPWGRRVGRGREDGQRGRRLGPARAWNCLPGSPAG